MYFREIALFFLACFLSASSASAQVVGSLRVPDLAQAFTVTGATLEALHTRLGLSQNARSAGLKSARKRSVEIDGA